MGKEHADGPVVEAWLRGPIAGISPLLMPAAHALVGAREDLHAAASALPTGLLWQRPGGAAAAGFHLRHIAGSLERLYAYARGLPLSEAQRAALHAEGTPGDPPASAAELLEMVDRSIEAALDVLRSVADDALLERREVGRARLPSTTLGLLFHGAEHTQRHTGQLITTVKVVAASTDRGLIP